MKIKIPIKNKLVNKSRDFGNNLVKLLYKTKIAIVKTNPTNKIKLFNSFSLYQMTILLNIFFIIFIF